MKSTQVSPRVGHCAIVAAGTIAYFASAPACLAQSSFAGFTIPISNMGNPIDARPFDVVLAETNSGGPLYIWWVDRGQHEDGSPTTTVDGLAHIDGIAIGSETTFPMGSEPMALSVGDLDDDGLNDIVTADGKNRSISSRRGLGLGAIQG